VKHLGRYLVVLASLLVVHAGCGGDDGGGSSFTQAEAVEATKQSLGLYFGAAVIIAFSTGGETGEFDIPTECTGNGTLQFTGTVTAVSDDQLDVSFDAKATNCGEASSAIDGTAHYEANEESIEVTGRWTFSGDTLSGACSFDYTATPSAHGETMTIARTTCGVDVSDDYPASDFFEVEPA
jgi:hypothetical protein